MRLVDSHINSSGQVEILHQGEWGGICSSGWDEQDAKVICNQLGYTSGLSTTWNRKHNSSYPVWMSWVYCFGTEIHLHECVIGHLIRHPCDSEYGMAGVVCSNYHGKQLLHYNY